MNSQKNRKELANSFIHTYLFEQEHNIANEILLDNCIMQMSLGLCFGREMVNSKFKFWKGSFRVHTLKSCEAVVSNHCIFYQFVTEAEHIGTFKGIAPTHNNVVINTMAIVDVNDEKIGKACVSSDIGSIIQQIGGANENVVADKAAVYHPNPLGDIIEILKKDLGSNHINLTKKQLAILCLWVTGKSDTEIALIVGVTARTIHDHQNTLKTKFNCRNKKQLTEKTKYLNMDHLLAEGFMVLVTNSSQSNKMILN